MSIIRFMIEKAGCENQNERVLLLGQLHYKQRGTKINFDYDKKDDCVRLLNFVEDTKIPLKLTLSTDSTNERLSFPIIYPMQFVGDSRKYQLLRTTINLGRKLIEIANLKKIIQSFKIQE